MKSNLMTTVAASAVLALGLSNAAAAEELTLCWAAWDPANALIENAAGRLPLLLPTQLVLQWLAEHSSVQGLIAAAQLREIKPKLPRPMKNHDGTEVWAVVDAVTGEVLIEDQPAPKLSELTGLPR